MEARLAMPRRRAGFRPRDRALAVLVGLVLLVIGAVNGPTRATAQTPALPACSPADLSATQTAEPVSGVPAGQVPDIFPGRITYTNTSSIACTLEGRPLIQALSGSGEVLPVQNNPLPPEQTSFFTIILQPGQTAFTVFSWFNFCGPTPTPPLSFAATLPTGGTPITVPLVTTTGAPLEVAPRCVTPSRPSSIGVGPFDAGPGAATSPPSRGVSTPSIAATAAPTTVAAAPAAPVSITPVAVTATPTAVASSAIAPAVTGSAAVSAAAVSVSGATAAAAPAALPRTGGPPVPLAALVLLGGLLLGFGLTLRARLR